MANVLFKTGTQAQYDALTTKNENALYWLLDTQKLYKGELLFAVGTEATTASAGLLSATDKAKLDALVTGSITDIQALDNSGCRLRQNELLLQHFLLVLYLML